MALMALAIIANFWKQHRPTPHLIRIGSGHR